MRLADSIKPIQIIASVGRLGNEEHCTSELHSPIPEISKLRPGFELISQPICSLQQNLPPIVRAPSKEHQNSQVLPGDCKTCTTEKTVEIGQASGHPLLQTNSAPTIQLKVIITAHSSTARNSSRLVPSHMHPPQSQRMTNRPHFVHIVRAQDNAKIRCGELVAEQPLLETCPNVRDL